MENMVEMIVIGLMIKLVLQLIKFQDIKVLHPTKTKRSQPF